MKFKLCIVMIIFAAMLLSACTGISDSQVDQSAIEDKLGKLNAYKETLPDIETVNQNQESTGVETPYTFGLSKDIVQMTETLPLNKAYTDALDYSGGQLYGYDMLKTYWFNGTDQLESVSYSMQGDAFLDTVNSLMAGLSGDYGEPTNPGYYDKADKAVTVSSDTEAMQAVDNDGVYYYAAFKDANGINIELYARKTDTSYDYWVYFTDYTYYEK